MQKVLTGLEESDRALDQALELLNRLLIGSLERLAQPLARDLLGAPEIMLDAFALSVVKLNDRSWLHFADALDTPYRRKEARVERLRRG